LSKAKPAAQYLSKLPPCFLNVLNVAVEGVCVSHKKWGGGEWGRTGAWSTGVRYNRILDPVMSFHQGVRQGGGEQKKNQPDKRPIKNLFIAWWS
jgi:hypothetical protein